VLQLTGFARSSAPAAIVEAAGIIAVVAVPSASAIRTIGAALIRRVFRRVEIAIVVPALGNRPVATTGVLCPLRRV
jgi:hypothetical protein